MLFLICNCLKIKAGNQSMHPPLPAWRGVKNFRKVFAGGGGGSEIFILLEGGGHVILK